MLTTVELQSLWVFDVSVSMQRKLPIKDYTAAFSARTSDVCSSSAHISCWQQVGRQEVRHADKKAGALQLDAAHAAQEKGNTSQASPGPMP